MFESGGYASEAALGPGEVSRPAENGYGGKRVSEKTEVHVPVQPPGTEGWNEFSCCSEDEGGLTKLVNMKRLWCCVNGDKGGLC